VIILLVAYGINQFALHSGLSFNSAVCTSDIPGSCKRVTIWSEVPKSFHPAPPLFKSIQTTAILLFLLEHTFCKPSATKSFPTNSRWCSHNKVIKINSHCFCKVTSNPSKKPIGHCLSTKKQPLYHQPPIFLAYLELPTRLEAFFFCHLCHLLH